MKDSLEQQLKAALSRQEPPEGFADRTVQRLSVVRGPVVPRWALAFAAALALVVIFAGLRQWQIHSQRESERQLVYALRLTSQKLSAVNLHLKKSAIHVSVQENNL